jgi:intracellular multiplication protein IcmK
MRRHWTKSVQIMLLAGVWQVVHAQEQPDQLVQIAGPAAQSNQIKFQDWLKNNGQQPAESLLSTTDKTDKFAMQDTHSASGGGKTPALTVVDDKDSPVISPPMTYSQSQQLMLNAAPPAEKTPPDPDAEEAFNAMLKQNAPLTPQQVIRLHQVIDESQRAASISPTVPPKPVSSTIMINLAPGATPPAIRLAQRHVTSLVFVDSTGSPWPIASYDIGDSKAITPQWDGKSNILLIQALSPYDDSDLVVRLAGLPTPITLELVPGQRVVDARTDIHVPGIGPNSKDLPLGTGLPDNADQVLLDVLDGIAPSHSKQLMVKGGRCQAWLAGSTMYLRTRLTVLSPGWVGRMKSPDGMMAYKMQLSSSVLVSQYGKPVELRIGGL